MSELIITSGSDEHFRYLKNFTTTLRREGLYEGELVICDNKVKGKWNDPEGIKKGISFSKEQMSFFNRHDVRVIPFSEIMEELSISVNDLNKGNGRTKRLPYKMIYCYEISNWYKNEAKKICYFDSDVLFQSNVKKIFGNINDYDLLVATENKSKIKNSVVFEWIKDTKFKYKIDKEDVLKEIENKNNICTGFFGGSYEVFNKFSLMAWAISESKLIGFFSDQPLFNIIYHKFGYPSIKKIDKTVRHMSECDIEKISFREGKLVYKDETPSAMHFNGPTNEIYDNIIKRESNRGRYIESWLKRLGIKIKRALRIVKKTITQTE